MGKKNKAETEEEIDPHQYYLNRKKDLAQYQAETGFSLYPNRFITNISLKEFIEDYDGLEAGEHVKPEEDEEKYVAGRIDAIRSSGKKLFFFHIWERGHKIQIMARLNEYENETQFFQTMNVLRRGDVIGAIGYPAKTKLGELSLIPRRVVLLSPCLQMLSARPDSLKDQEVRYRQRYLDLRINEKTREIFMTRTTVVREIRKFLEERGFQEVETPMMSLIPGGATAKPFITHHNELKLDLYLRIAPELFLKKLVIGGLDRVFEIGKNFRNEGIDPTHNPEFTSCEFYMAYANYEDLMWMTQQLISEICARVFGSCHPWEIEYNGQMIDLGPPPETGYPRMPMISTLETKLGVKFPTDLESEETRIWLSELCTEKQVDCPAPRTTARLLDKLVGAFLEPDCVQPTFITDHPRIMSPLAKPREDNPQLTERFELFIAGKEICNAFTELNDPEIQAECFRAQEAQKATGDDEAMPPDMEFVTALEYGLPPTAGWGMGIDRLVMLLTGQVSIKEVILFPTMKPVLHPNEESEKTS